MSSRNAMNAVRATQTETVRAPGDTKMMNLIARMNDNLDRALGLAGRQKGFIDRFRGTHPEAATDKAGIKGEPVSIVAKLEDQIDAFEQILAMFTENTNELEKIA